MRGRAGCQERAVEQSRHARQLRGRRRASSRALAARLARQRGGGGEPIGQVDGGRRRRRGCRGSGERRRRLDQRDCPNERSGELCRDGGDADRVRHDGAGSNCMRGTSFHAERQDGGVGVVASLTAEARRDAMAGRVLRLPQHAPRHQRASLLEVRPACLGVQRRARVVEGGVGNMRHDAGEEHTLCGECERFRVREGPRGGATSGRTGWRADANPQGSAIRSQAICLRQSPCRAAATPQRDPDQRRWGGSRRGGECPSCRCHSCGCSPGGAQVERSSIDRSASRRRWRMHWGCDLLCRRPAGRGSEPLWRRARGEQ
mmetsp:Transcript_20334/g.48842  ORF Transcript_20334/g.48842 Transcript_20334/m.48842 type:complete len:317 (-) Transcript_20334:914-1864(-)